MTRHRKLVVVDAGCRWGFADGFLSQIDSFEIFGFDPDPVECEKLNRKYSHPSIKAIPLALSDSPGERTIHLTKEPACSSLYRPDPFLTENYAAFHCEVEVGRETITVVTLDKWCQQNGVGWIDHLKIDTQGSELDILRGAQTSLRTVRSIEVEVEFNPMYVGQPLFHEIDKFLRELGFELWKFSEVTHYSRNRKSGPAINALDIRFDDWHSEPVKVYAGQLFWANAHYVRRGISSEVSDSSQRHRDAVLFAALGMPDVLGDQDAWSDEIVNTIKKNIQRVNLVDRAIREARDSQLNAEYRAHQADERAARLRAELQQALAEGMQLRAIYASTSWRITGPVRWCGHHVRLFRKHGLTLVKKILRQAMLYARTRHPKLKVWGLAIAARFGLAECLRRIYLGDYATAIQISPTQNVSRPRDLVHLSPRANQIYYDLRAAVDAEKPRGG